MFGMRTTLAIDDDLAGLLKRRSRELGPPFKEVINRTLRAGLGEQAKPRQHTAPKTIPHSFGFRPGIDLDKHGLPSANFCVSKRLKGSVAIA